MTFDEFQKKLEQMDFHIRSHSTGSPEEFSEKLNISRSTFFKYCDYLKELGAEIEFDKSKNTYVYKQSGRLKLLCFEPVGDEEMRKISGGNNIFHFFEQSEIFGLGSPTFAP